MNELSITKPPSKIKKNNKYRIPSIILFLIFFSNSTLRNEKYLAAYISLSLFICVLVFSRGMFKPSRIIRTFLSGINFWLISLFSMYFFYGVVLTKYSYFNTRYFFFIFLITLVSILLFIDIPINNTIEILVKVCGIASIAVCMFILLNEWSLIILGGIRIGESGSGNANTVSEYLGIMSIPCIYKVIFEKKYRYLIPYGISIIIMLLTGSKQALLYIFFALMILSVLKNGIKLYKYFLPMILIIAILFFIFNNEFLYNIIGYRIIDFLGSLGFNIESANQSHSTVKRLTMISLGIKAFISKPIFGGGWFYFSAYSGLGTYSHNNYIELLSTYGLVGFLIYYSMFLNILLKLKKLIKTDNYAKLLFTMLTLVFIGDLVSVSFSINILNYQVLVFAYLYVRSMKKEKSNLKLRTVN